MEQSILTNSTLQQDERPAFFARSLALMKPVTWFAPMWAFLCGAIASGQTGNNLATLLTIGLGLLMAGPVLCGLSQVINDYFDREIDAVNEPDRLIPSGQVPLWQIGLTIAVLLTIGTGIALILGRGVVLMMGIGLFLAICYSAPPIRAKRNGWAGNTLVAIAYEGLAWLAGHLAFAALTPASFVIAALYSFGAHGIMSINDYKSIDGDRAGGIKTIPVLHGVHGAAWLIVITMNLAQLGVMIAFFAWGQYYTAVIIAGILLIQLPTQRAFLREPADRYLTFSAIGVNFFVWGMMVAAIGLRGV